MRQLITALLLCACFISTAHAIRLIPLTATMVTDDDGTRRTFRIQNPAEQPAAVQISIFARATQLDGTEIRTPADQLFTVFPAQMVIMPGETQAVRVEWLSAITTDHEQAFRIIAEQLAIDFNESKQQTREQIKLLMRYEGMIYIQPKLASAAKIDVLDSRYIDKPTPALQVTLKNTGDTHLVLKKPFLQLTNAQYQLKLQGLTISDLLNTNMLAGETRQFTLPWPKDFNPDKFTTTLHFAPPDRPIPSEQ
jgi:fimbrial chaperone protein